MHTLLTRETPAKVMGFLGAAIFSMAFLFAVSASNASFGRAEYALADPFAPGPVIGAIDAAAAKYSRAVAEFARPAKQSFALHIQQAAWVMDEAAAPLVDALGLEKLAGPYGPSEPRVAGAFTLSGPKQAAFSVDSLYSALLGD